MIENKPDFEDNRDNSRFRETLPDAAPLLDALVRHPDPFSVSFEGGSCEIEPLREVDGRKNRTRIKVFSITGGPFQNRVAVYFYKPSQIPNNPERHSYGVCIIPDGGPAPEEAREWLFFGSSGFHPYARPSRLRQAFSFTVPD